MLKIKEPYNCENTQNVAAKHETFMKMVSQVQRNHKNNWGLGLLDNSLLATLRARELETEAQKTSTNIRLSGNQSEFVKKSIEQGRKAKEKFSKIAFETFHNIYKDIIDNGPDSQAFPGHNDMENFRVYS